jgi:ribosome-binding factor A
VTITRVETAPDLAHARVWVSIIGQASERAATLAALRGAMPFIRHQLGARVRLRRIPDLHVELDDTAERGTRVLQLLHELEEGRLPDDAPPVGESLPTPTARIPLEGEEPIEPKPAPARRPGRPRAMAGGNAGALGTGGARRPRPAGKPGHTTRRPGKRRDGGPS